MSKEEPVVKELQAIITDLRDVRSRLGQFTAADRQYLIDKAQDYITSAIEGVDEAARALKRWPPDAK